MKEEFTCLLKSFEECSICKVPFEENMNSHVVLTSCGHIFHKPCLNRWISCKEDESDGLDYPSCPMCRSSMSECSTVLSPFICSVNSNLSNKHDEIIHNYLCKDVSRLQDGHKKIFSRYKLKWMAFSTLQTELEQWKDKCNNFMDKQCASDMLQNQLHKLEMEFIKLRSDTKTIQYKCERNLQNVKDKRTEFESLKFEHGSKLGVQKLELILRLNSLRDKLVLLKMQISGLTTEILSWMEILNLYNIITPRPLPLFRRRRK